MPSKLTNLHIDSYIRDVKNLFYFLEIEEDNTFEEISGKLEYNIPYYSDYRDVLDEYINLIEDGEMFVTNCKQAMATNNGTCPWIQSEYHLYYNRVAPQLSRLYNFRYALRVWRREVVANENTKAA